MHTMIVSSAATDIEIWQQRTLNNTNANFAAATAAVAGDNFVRKSQQILKISSRFWCRRLPCRKMRLLLAQSIHTT